MTNQWTEEIERLRVENGRLHKEANINMQEICRLRGELTKLMAAIVLKAREK